MRWAVILALALCAPFIALALVIDALTRRT